MCFFIDIKPQVMPLKFQWMFFPISQWFAVTDFILSALAAREENLHQLSPSALLLDWQLGGAHHEGHPPDGGGDAARAGGGENDICAELWSEAWIFPQLHLFPPILGRPPYSQQSRSWNAVLSTVLFFFSFFWFIYEWFLKVKGFISVPLLSESEIAII